MTHPTLKKLLLELATESGYNKQTGFTPLLGPHNPHGSGTESHADKRDRVVKVADFIVHLPIANRYGILPLTALVK